MGSFGRIESINIFIRYKIPNEHSDVSTASDKEIIFLQFNGCTCIAKNRIIKYMSTMLHLCTRKCI